MNIPLQVIRLLENEKHCFLATCHLDKPHLSLMLFTYLAADGLVVLSSRSDTTKVRNIRKNREVAILLYSTGGTGEKPFSCTLYGKAKVLPHGEDNFFREAHNKKHSGMDNFIAGENISIITVDFKNAVISDIDDSVQTWSAE